MTIETRTYIDVDDIQGIRVRCSACGVTSQVGFDGKGHYAVMLSERMKCPHCNQQWFSTLNDGRLTAIIRFVDSLKEMRIVAGQMKPDNNPIGLTLEVSSSLALDRVDRAKD
jgi:hypothetical protein